MGGGEAWGKEEGWEELWIKCKMKLKNKDKKLKKNIKKPRHNVMRKETHKDDVEFIFCCTSYCSTCSPPLKVVFP